MKSPRFSIVMPTRNRLETLRHALRTCTSQTFGDLEIIVFDNFSSSSAAPVVQEAEDARIRYFRSDKPLAMSDSWEAALSRASGEYTFILGDDDGLLPHGLEDVDRVLRETRAKALRWDRVYYNWPNCPIAGGANRLVLPLHRDHKIIDARAVVARIARFQADYTLLPMLYNSAIHRDLVQRLRAKSGRVFDAPHPDVYSGFAFAMLVGEYHSLAHPISINASSATSNGIATIALDGRGPVAQEFQRFNEGAGWMPLPQVPALPVISAPIAESYLRAATAIGPPYSSSGLDRKRLALSCIEELSGRAGADQDDAVRRVRESLADSPGLQRWFDHQVAARSPRATQRGDLTWSRGVTRPGTLELDASDFGAVDVYAVSLLCSKLLGRPPEVVDWSRGAGLPMWRRLRTAARILVRGS